MRNLSSVATRRANAFDFAALADVQRKSQTTVMPRSFDWSDFSSETHFIYLAEDEEVFGFVCAGEPMADSSPNEFGVANSGEIIGWFVLPTHSNCGMGKKLLVRGLSVLKRRGFESAFLWLEVQDQVKNECAEKWNVKNKAAHHIVSALGFEQFEITRTTMRQGTSTMECGFRLGLEDYF